MTGTGKPIGLRPLQAHQPLGGMGRLLRRLLWRGPGFFGVFPPLPVLTPGDPQRAQQIYRGQFNFAGQTLHARPAEIFTAPAPSTAWRETLMSFIWLADFRAADLALYRAFSRAMVTAFAELHPPGSFIADCRRLAALSRNAGFLAAGASEDFTTTFLAFVSDETQRLAAARPRHLADQLRQALALLTACLAFRGNAGLRSEQLKRVTTLSAAMILDDGGPADRNPQTLLSLLAALVPIADALAAQRCDVPPALERSIARGLSGLRALTAGGRLAVFQGVDRLQPEALEALLALGSAAPSPLTFLPHAGFCRMQQGSAVVIADCGAPALCRSPLAFELSDGGQRIAGNCGLPPHASPAWREAAASTAAHSTLEIDGAARRAAPDFLARRGSAAMTRAEAVETPHGVLLKAQSLAEAAAFGIVHQRDLFLAASGNDLRGEDRFERAEGGSGEWPDAGFVIRFHLAPGLRATLDRAGSAITLVTPERTVWQVTARGGDIHLEDSLFLATGGAAEACKQIVIRGRVGRPDRINWAFKKLAAPESPLRRSS